MTRRVRCGKDAERNTKAESVLSGNIPKLPWSDPNPVR